MITSACQPPWTMEGTDLDGYCIRDANGCLITPENSVPKGQASLIAAAPELREALEELTARFSLHMKLHGDNESITRARAAIAKATGGQP